MTQEQLAGELIGDEAYAGARNFESLERAVNRVLGHTYVCPTHNLLGCLKLVVATMVPAGATVASNSQWLADVLAPRSIAVADVRTQDDSLFTGNVDLQRRPLAGDSHTLRTQSKS